MVALYVSPAITALKTPRQFTTTPPLTTPLAEGGPRCTRREPRGATNMAACGQPGGPDAERGAEGPGP